MKPHCCFRNGQWVAADVTLHGCCVDTSRLISALGGPAAVARRFKIRGPSVIGWRERGIPAARLQTLQAWAVVQPDIAAALVAAGFPAVEPEREAA